MANWLENLKGIINIDFSGLKSANFQIFSGNKDSPLIHIGKKEDNSKTVTVNINVNAEELTLEKRNVLLAVVKEATLEDYNRPILDNKAIKVVNDISRRREEYWETFEYFKDKIPTADVPLLRTALYIRSVSDHAGQVEMLKQDVGDKYGQRGRYLVNLCTTGYFESHLKPLYEELKTREDFTPKMFIAKYNLIIDGAPFAVFVSRSKSLEELIDEVEQKLLFNKQYGIKTLNIHAIGAINVTKVKSLLNDKKISDYFTSEPDISAQGGLMDVKVYF